MTQKINSLRTFAYIHDDLPAFHAGYLVLTILVATMLNLGAFALLVLIHMALDIVKYREYHNFSWNLTIEATIRESLIDVTLLIVGLVFAVYLHHEIGIASISGLMRAEVSVIRGVAMFVPKVKILHHFLKIVSHIHHYIEQTHPRLQKGWSQLDKLCFAFIGISFFFLVVSAEIMHVDHALVRNVLFNELIPWNF